MSVLRLGGFMKQQHILMALPAYLERRPTLPKLWQPPMHTMASPRGPVTIYAESGGIVIYMRKVERIDGELYNNELKAYEAVKDPAW